jgi:hypothetical protein
LITDQIAWRVNYCRLPPVGMIPANLDINVSYTQGSNEHIAKLFCGFEFLGHWNIPYEHLGLLNDEDRVSL